MPEYVRIIVLVDETGSMGSYCSSVGTTLKQLFPLLDVLFEGTAQVNIISYRDYSDGGKLLRVCNGDRRESLKVFASGLAAGGGGDTPEAVKTALNHVMEMLRDREACDPGAALRTLVIHYTDAPPHHALKVGSSKEHLAMEQATLKDKKPGFDWVQICKAFKQMHTPVITFLPSKNALTSTTQFFTLLGDVVKLKNTEPETITKYTIGALLQLMGQRFDGIEREFDKDSVALSFLDTEMSERFIERLSSGTSGRVEACSFDVHTAFSRDLRNLVLRFQSSEEFQDVVFNALRELFVKESVLAMTYNSVFGLLWRLVCRMREDPRVQRLRDALSTCCTSLTGSAQQQLRIWIDESYDQCDEIRELISSVPDPLIEGVLVLDVSKQEDMPTKEEMRSILHAPSPGVLRKVQALLTRLIVVRSGGLPTIEKDGTVVPMYVPIALKDQTVFSLVSHLLLPGMMTSLRPAAMLAITAYLSGNAILQPRARCFLDSIKGNWIPPIEKIEDFPEILNGEFVRLVARVPEFLTENELALYSHLRLILRVRRAGKLLVPLRVGYIPALRDLTPDVKLLCKDCGHRRSMTLMKDGTCVLCLNGVGTESPVPEPDEDKSRLVECRCCHALYAVVRTEKLTVPPKCHYCRNQEPLESVVCIQCSNRFCAPTASCRVDDFVCAVCSTEPASGFADRSVELSSLAEANPGTLCCLGLPETARAHVFDRLGLYKLWTSSKDSLMAVEPTRLNTLTFAGKTVKNVPSVFDMIVEQVLHGRLLEMCNMCFDEQPLSALQSACGTCQTLACRDCLGRWYGQLVPGRIYVPSEGLCAFCKRTPKVSTLRSFNRLACRLAGRRSLQLRGDMYYGWCRSCFKIAEAMPRDCAAETPELTNFQCESCKEKELLQKGPLEGSTKQCPRCKTATLKLSGCNHMSCPCGAHWCWQCCGDFAASQIYDHMQAEHGSIGFDDFDDFTDEDE